MTHEGEARYGRLLLGTIRGTLRGSGRSTRTEIGLFVVVAYLVQLPLALIVMAMPLDRSGAIMSAISWLVMIPLPALFIRRVHDHGRSAWWLTVLLFLALKEPAMSLVAMGSGIETRVALDQQLYLLDWVSVVAGYLLIALALAPGNPGENRFGPDPRERPALNPPSGSGPPAASSSG